MASDSPPSDECSSSSPELEPGPTAVNPKVNNFLSTFRDRLLAFLRSSRTTDGAGVAFASGGVDWHRNCRVARQITPAASITLHTPFDAAVELVAPDESLFEGAELPMLMHPAVNPWMGIRQPYSHVTSRAPYPVVDELTSPIQPPVADSSPLKTRRLAEKQPIQKTNLARSLPAP